MTFNPQDGVIDSSTTTGTSDYVCSGVPAVWGNIMFGLAASLSNGDTILYRAYQADATTGVIDNTAGVEYGLGTWTTGTLTLARTTVYRSSNSGSKVSWGAGTRFIEVVQLVQGPLVIRQPGGTVGADEVQIDQTSGNANIRPATGQLHVRLIGGSYVQINCSDFICGSNKGRLLGSQSPASLQMDKDSNIGFNGFSASTGNGNDIALIRLAKSVFGLTNLQDSVNGWIQNTAGEAALASNFSKANATLGSTNLSLTFVAGRSYRIEGYLIVSNSTAGEGSQFDFNGGTATITTFDVAFNAVGTNTPGTVVSTTLAGVVNYTSITGTNRIFVRGYAKVNAGGTIILRGAENTTSTGTLTLAAGSWLAAYDTVNL